MTKDSRKQLILKNEKLIKEHQSLVFAINTGVSLINSALNQSNSDNKINWKNILKTAEKSLEYQIEANELLQNINLLQLRLNEEQGLLSMGMSGGLIAKKLRSKNIKKAISEGEMIGRELVDDLRKKITIVKQKIADS